MEIKECGELNSFETMPKETTMFLSAVTYDGISWFGGPSSYNKDEVIMQLSSYAGVLKVRIYSVKLPVLSKPA